MVVTWLSSSPGCCGGRFCCKIKQYFTLIIYSQFLFAYDNVASKHRSFSLSTFCNCDSSPHHNSCLSPCSLFVLRNLSRLFYRLDILAPFRTAWAAWAASRSRPPGRRTSSCPVRSLGPGGRGARWGSGRSAPPTAAGCPPCSGSASPAWSTTSGEDLGAALDLDRDLAKLQ